MKNTLQFRSRGQLVIQLQQFLNIQGFFIITDGIFGYQTENAIKSYQKKNNLFVSGMADQEFISLITQKTRLDTWCLSIKDMEGYIAPCAKYPIGTPAWRNNNPGNIRSGNSFIKFSTYQDGYNALRNLLIRACTGQSKVYNANGTLYDFYALYAPTSDSNDPRGYAEKVAHDMGCTVDTIIKTLLQ